MQHHHKYLRFKFPNGKPAFRCILKGCSHYAFPELYVGKPAICWGCEKEIAIEKIHLNRQKPKCSKCMKTKKPMGAIDLLKALKP